MVLATVISKKDRESFKIHDFIYGTDGSGGENAIFKNFEQITYIIKKEVFDMNGPEI